MSSIRPSGCARSPARRSTPWPRPDAFSGYLANDAGWFKGSAQMMQGMAFAVGGYDVCSSR